jgi:hypothetical protein
MNERPMDWGPFDTPRKALDALIEHVLADEMEDYRNHPTEKHIYHAIYMLAKMQDWGVPSPKDLLDGAALQFRRPRKPIRGRARRIRDAD